MQEVDSAWSRFLVVPYVAFLCYGLVGIFCHAPFHVEAFTIAAAITAGFVSAQANNWPEKKPLYPVDWLLPPLLAYGIVVVLILSLHAPAWWALPAAFILLAGYCAGDPNFGSAIVTFFVVELINILILPFMFLTLAYIAIDYLVEHKARVVFRTHFVLTIGSALLMIVGWFIGEIRFVAIGLGYNLGLVNVSEFSSSGLTRSWLLFSLTISVLALAGRVNGIENADVMYAVTAGFIALTLASLESPSGKVGSL